MRVLLTGGSGFLGSRVKTELSLAGHNVHSLARSSIGAENETQWDFLSDVPSGIPDCDVVVHLAASVDFSSEAKISLFEEIS